jgi:adenylate cyclase
MVDKPLCPTIRNVGAYPAPRSKGVAMNLVPNARPHEESGSKDNLSLSTQEVERKWLVAELPDLDGLKAKTVVQGYIAIADDGTEVRVRQKGERYFQTVKSDGGLVRSEFEVELTKEQYDVLWQATAGRQLEKIRYEILSDAVKIELDVYRGTLEGLVVAEIEFSSVRESERFSPPDWFGVEVTTDGRYKNKHLASKGRPEDL